MYIKQYISILLLSTLHIHAMETPPRSFDHMLEQAISNLDVAKVQEVLEQRNAKFTEQEFWHFINISNAASGNSSRYRENMNLPYHFSRIATKYIAPFTIMFWLLTRNVLLGKKPWFEMMQDGPLTNKIFLGISLFFNIPAAAIFIVTGLIYKYHANIVTKDDAIHDLLRSRKL